MKKVDDNLNIDCFMYQLFRYCLFPQSFRGQSLIKEQKKSKDRTFWGTALRSKQSYYFSYEVKKYTFSWSYEIKNSQLHKYSFLGALLHVHHCTMQALHGSVHYSLNPRI
jgi:hypothetical protein